MNADSWDLSMKSVSNLYIKSILRRNLYIKSLCNRLISVARLSNSQGSTLHRNCSFILKFHLLISEAMNKNSTKNWKSKLVYLT